NSSGVSSALVLSPAVEIRRTTLGGVPSGGLERAPPTCPLESETKSSESVEYRTCNAQAAGVSPVVLELTATSTSTSVPGRAGFPLTIDVLIVASCAAAWLPKRKARTPHRKRL